MSEQAASRTFAPASLPYAISYGNQFTTFTVSAERDAPDFYEGTSTGYVNRYMSIQMQEDLWVFPGSEARRLDELFVFGSYKRQTDAGIFETTEVFENGPRLAVGQRYVAGFVLGQGDKLDLIGPEMVFRVESGRLVADSRHGPESRAFDGMTIAEFQRRLNLATPLPAVLPYLNVLEGDKRLSLSRGDGALPR